MNIIERILAFMGTGNHATEALSGKALLEDIKKEAIKNGANLTDYKNIKYTKWKHKTIINYECKTCGYKNKRNEYSFRKNDFGCKGCSGELKAYVYLLLNDKNEVKIGQTKDISKRLTGNYGDKKYTGLLSEDNYNLEKSIYIIIDYDKRILLEKEYHKLFEADHIKQSDRTISGKTEWFNNGEEIIEYVKNEWKDREELKSLKEIFKEA
jgi:hypothetical protein